MNVTNRLGAAVAGFQSVGKTVPPPSPVLARGLNHILVVTALFVVAGAAGLGLYASAHADRIYQGVRVAGVELGGLSSEAARAELDAYFATYAAAPLTLVAGDRSFQLTPADVGATLDSASTVEAAMAWGRDGSWWSRSQHWVKALFHGVAVAPAIALDPAAAHGSITAIATEIVRSPVDATLDFSSGGARIVPEITGVRLDYTATASALTARIAGLADDPVPLVTHPDPAGITAASLAPNLPEAHAAVDAPLTLAAGDAVWHVPPDGLRALIGIDPATSKVQVDRRPLTALVERLTAEINRDAVNAGITVDGNGRLAVVPSVSARKVDVAASVAAIADGLLAGDDEIALVVHETAPRISDAMAAAAVERGEAMMNPGIALTWNGGEGFLDRYDLLRALTIRTRSDAEEPFVFGLDPDHVWNSLSRYSNEFDRPVQDARWRIINGKVQLAIPESKGRALDRESGVRAVMAAFLDGKTEVELQARVILPRWTEADGKTIELGDDVLGEGGTYYGDSSDSRRQNIELGAAFVSGWLVPPDGVFSFADSVGLITEEKGFVTGYGIIDDGEGGFTTAPVTGGGICQVSTTLYQAAFWSGLPIVERHQHPYYLRNYGEAVTGLPGLDAMVNIEPDWKLDMKFRNTTGNWIAVTMIPDGAMVYARIVGTDPGWDVVVPEPEIFNEVKAPAEMRYTESSELPAGVERLVEQAQDGFDVTVTRSVYFEEDLVLQDSVFSTFAPSQNTTMRGTGTGEAAFGG
jgi:vancomycin resistance protein YoaR